MADLNGETHQSLSSLLCTDECDYLIRNNGEKVLVSELVGKTKTIGLFSAAHWCRTSRSFAIKLVNVYNKLKDRGEDLEVVFLSWDRNQKAFDKYYRTMPWLALPFGDKRRDSVDKLYGRHDIPTFIVVDPDGKEVSNSTDAVAYYGSKAYPFTEERLETLRKEFGKYGKPEDTVDEDQYTTDESYGEDAEEEDATDKPSEEGAVAAVDEGHVEKAGALEAEEKAKREAQTLESILVSDKRNFVIKHGGDQVLVSELVGKIVGLYFSAHWCPPCQRFTPELAKVYNELKEKGEAFEIVFISWDHNEEAFEEYYRSMPWLALPFGDKNREDLDDLYDVTEIPTLIVVHPDGEKVTKGIDASDAIIPYGAKAYPFTDAHLQALENKIEEHEKADTAIDENSKPAGVICDGDVCYRAD